MTLRKAFSFFRLDKQAQVQFILAYFDDFGCCWCLLNILLLAKLLDIQTLNLVDFSSMADMILQSTVFSTYSTWSKRKPV